MTDDTSFITATKERDQHLLGEEITKNITKNNISACSKR